MSQPLYLFPKFFEDKATEHLLGNGIKPKHLNEHKIGRVMDKLYDFGLSELFLDLALAAAQKYNINLDFSHLDSSSFSVHGQYDKEKSSDNKLNQETEPIPITITHGYSRDPSGSQSLMGETPKTALTHHRPDLKQFIVDLIVAGDGNIPVLMK